MRNFYQNQPIPDTLLHIWPLAQLAEQLTLNQIHPFRVPAHTF
jgi:hypothetical protein